MTQFAPSPYTPELCEACEIRLDLTGDHWWLVRFVGGTGLPPVWRFLSLDDEALPSCATVIEMRPVCS